MKKIFVIFFVILGLVLSFYILREDLYAYSCKSGYYCNTNGGAVIGTVYLRGSKVDPLDNTKVLDCKTITDKGYTCSGTASSCIGGLEFYRSEADCLAGKNLDGQYCCDKITCTPNCKNNSCAHTCDTGYTTENNGCKIKKSLSCDLGSDGCGGSCGKDPYTCWYKETNTIKTEDMPVPKSLSIIIDGVTFQLSTNRENSTKIKLPANIPDPNVKLSVPTITAPSSTSGVGYIFKGFNDGINSEWGATTTCNPGSCPGVDGEDFYIQDITNIQTFKPTSKSVLQVLKEKATGKIAAMNYYQNVCNEEKVVSLSLEGFYSVDSAPIADIVVDINNSPGNQQGISSNTTVKNCTTNTYSGLKANNPLRFNASLTDTDSNNEIEALIIWFSKDESTPALVNITNTYTESNINDFGVMIRKNNGSWNSPLIYSTNSDNSWRTLTNTDKLAVHNLTIKEESSVNITFDLEFKPTSNNPAGLYNVYGTGLDSLMINNNVVDQSRMTDLFNWGIDLVNPSVEQTSQQILDVSNFLLSWKASDTEGPLKEVVLNGYRTGGQQNSKIELFAPPTYEDSKGYINAIPIPPESEIGNIGDYDSSWEFVDRTTYNDLFTDGWFNNNWLYRKPITISNTTSTARTNEDVLITLDTKDLIDTGKLQADCGDLRFLDNDDETRLNYWIENGCNTENTNIWVRIPSFPKAGKTIYMYYSNPSAPNGTVIWNGEITMLADAGCPSGWTRNSDFDNRFPYGANTYGNTGGSNSHQHYISPLRLTVGKKNDVGGTATVITSGTKTNPLVTGGILSKGTHSHTVEISDKLANHLPPYLSMVFCKKDGFDTGKNLITMFKSSNIPTGWTRFTSLDGKYPYGKNIYGTTGGSETHSHTFNFTSSGAGVKMDARSGEYERGAIKPSHKHTIDVKLFTESNNIPPSIKMVYAKNINSEDLSNAVIISNSQPPIGWDIFSILNNKFPVGSPLYDSTPIGYTDHTHTWNAEFPSINESITISNSSGTAFGIAHKHTMTANQTTPSASILPPYRSAIFITRKDSENISVGPELKKGEKWPLVGVNNLKNVTAKINIGENEGGKINMYVTAYDQACNYNSKFENIDLNPWITAKGGSVYSMSGITNATKNVAGLDILKNVFKHLKSEELDTGTEVVASGNDILPNLLHPELKGVRAMNIYDSNSRKTYWFDHFKDKLNSEKASSAKKISSTTDSCPTGVCYVYSEEDITVNSNFQCKDKLLVMSEKNITINPDITSSSSNTGCIFLAKENIYIGDGTYKSASSSNIQYDYIDAYLIAQGRIIFNLVDLNKTIRDGVEINGGLVAFGNNLTQDSAILILRNLKLLNVSNPTVVVNYDYKYPNIATLFFGVEAPIYKLEIGFKPF